MSTQKNFVSLEDKTIRIFKNPILDWMSRIHWVAPLSVWIPIITYCLYTAILGDFKTKISTVFIIFIIAIFCWTFIEYFLHRFVFHFHTSNELGKKLLFVLHGIHHDYPNDSKRLVMPPLMSILISIPFAFLSWKLFGGSGLSFTFFAGLVSGYLIYDMTHYAVHHARINNNLFNKLKKHHMAHHFVAPHEAFGVSSTLWDNIFNTTLTKNKDKK